MTMNSPYALELSNINKEYHNTKVLQNISFNIIEGEIVGFIGLNGTGKTTLIKAILDLLSINSGSIKINKHSQKTKANKQDIAYLPEKFTPSPLLKGKEFIRLTLLQKNKTTTIAKTQKILKELKLPLEALDLKIKHYSKGMVQKIGLAALFLSESPLLILDEPMSGLDPLTRSTFKNLLIKHRKSGKTTFFSSHILSDIEEICDRVVIINNHKIIFVGKPKEFKKLEKTTKLEKAFLQAIEK